MGYIQLDPPGEANFIYRTSDETVREKGEREGEDTNSSRCPGICSAKRLSSSEKRFRAGNIPQGEETVPSPSLLLDKNKRKRKK
jgi:hypothetical protein